MGSIVSAAPANADARRDYPFPGITTGADL